MSGQKLSHQVKSKEILVYTLEARFVTWFYKTWSECLFWQFPGQVRKYVMSGQKLGLKFKSEEILVYTLEVTFSTRF